MRCPRRSWPKTARSAAWGLAKAPIRRSRIRSGRISREELERIACWIDLAVPFCGDYTEANTWNETDKGKYARYQAKRERMGAEEAANIQALIASQTAEAP